MPTTMPGDSQSARPTVRSRPPAHPVQPEAGHIHCEREEDMTNAKQTYTPGPWHIEKWLDEVDQIERKAIAVPTQPTHSPKHVASICTWGGAKDPEADANARLIAAAPTMYDLLKRIAETPCDHGAQEFCPRDEARKILATVHGKTDRDRQAEAAIDRREADKHDIGEARLRGER